MGAVSFPESEINPILVYRQGQVNNHRRGVMSFFQERACRLDLVPFPVLHSRKVVYFTLSGYGLCC